MAALPGAASAETTSFKFDRVNSIPEVQFVAPLNNILTTVKGLAGNPPGFPTDPLSSLVASPLGYPASDGVLVGLGHGACTTGPAPVRVFAPPFAPTAGQVNSNAIGDDCDAFLRRVEGRHEDSPGAFPGLHIQASFNPAGPAVQKFTTRPPRGQLGNPYSAHQCSETDATLCDGVEPAFDSPAPPFLHTAAQDDQDQTELDGAKVGNATFYTDGPTCAAPFGCTGEVLNYDPRALPNPDDRGATAAQAIVLCKVGAGGLPAPLSLPVFGGHCAGRTGLATLAAALCPGPNCPVVFSDAGPIDVVPDEDHEGDYQLKSSIDFTKLRGLAPGEKVIKVDIQEFGLILQHLTGLTPDDPRQDPNNPVAALPFIFNPTACVTAVAKADAQFADGSTSNTPYQVFPNNDVPGDTNGAAERAWVENECTGYPWDHREVDPAASSTTNPDPVVPPGATTNPQNHIVTRDKPAAFRGDTTVNNFDKMGGAKSVPVETPSSLAAQFTTPTRGGIPYQSHYKEIQLTLKDTTLSPALAGRPGFKVCTRDQFDAGAFESADCPEDSKIGDLKAVSPLADGDLGQVPCHDAVAFSDCSKVNPFVFAHNGCFDANANPEAPCDNLTRHYDGPASWAATNGNPGASLDTIPGEVWAGPQVEGHPNQFRIFAQLRNNPSCVVNAPAPAGLCAEGAEVTPRLHVKLQGIATTDLQTGEIHAVFDDLPELPVFDVTQAFPGGDFAPFVSPSACGDHKYASEITPFASLRGDGTTVTDAPPAAQPDDTITTVEAPNAPCSGPHGFQPQLSLLSDPFTAGQDTSLTTTIKLADRSDNLVATDVALPDGLLGALGTVPLCPRDKARAGDCPATSQIGTVDIQVGNGGSPIHTPGKVYFSEPGAAGELARITVVVPAKAGPFDLGTTIINELAVKLRQDGGKIGLDNVGQDKLPTIIAGIPIRIRQLDLKIDREKFIRNPLTCDAKTGTGHFESLSGQKVDATAPFTATGCDTLAFTPKVEASIGTAAEPASLDGHPPVSTVVTQPDHEAAIGKAVVRLPQGLNPNVLALAVLCSPAQLTANACPAETRVGSAKAFSPLLPDPLTGPVYLVENAGGLPKLVIRLGGLLSLDLTGQSLLQGGRLVTTLDGLPATPVSRFELNFTGGPRGLFTVSGNLCTGARAIDGSFDSLTGQHASSSQAVSLVGSCAKAAAARKPSLAVRLSRVGTKSPRLTVRARAGSSRLSTLRVTIPKGLSVVTKGLRKGVAISAGGKKVTGKQWDLSRSGVLTVRGLPKNGRSSITVTIAGGALKASRKVKRAVPRLAFIGRLVDVKGTRYGYTVRVRPTR